MGLNSDDSCSHYHMLHTPGHYQLLQRREDPSVVAAAGDRNNSNFVDLTVTGPDQQASPQPQQPAQLALDGQ